MYSAYLLDDELWKDMNSKGHNYWDVYFEELFDSIGLKQGKAVQPSEIHWNELDYLLVGDYELSPIKDQLQHWVSEGGTAILFHTPSADQLLGFQIMKEMQQTDDPFSISAYMSLAKPFQESEYPNDDLVTLPIYSDYSCIKPDDQTEVLAMLHNPTIFGISGGDQTGFPAVCQKKIGKGKVVYFAFSLTQTLWVMQMGRPVDRDYDGDGYYRTADGITLTRAHDLLVPYADIYRELMSILLSDKPQPLLYELPLTAEGEAADILLHYGGDDESSPNYQMQASQVMKELGLPYHVNLMLNSEGEFAITKEQYEQLKDEGTIPSLHFDFFAPRKFYTQDELNAQLDKYIDAFGEVPKVVVNHVLMATGWAEQARWCSERGIKGDNTRVHKHLMPDYNPINSVGMAYGSSYPSHVYDDAEHQNNNLNFLNIPIVFFEPRIWPETEQEDKDRIDRVLDMSYRYKAALNIFAHPIYLVQEPAIIAAIQYIGKRIEEKGYRAIHEHNDYLFYWWTDRSEVSINQFARKNDAISFTCSSSRPFAVKVKQGEAVYQVNQSSMNGRSITIAGVDWMLYSIPAGELHVEIQLK